MYWQAWNTLCGIRGACKNYLRPGLSLPVQNYDTNCISPQLSVSSKETRKIHDKNYITQNIYSNSIYGNFCEDQNHHTTHSTLLNAPRSYFGSHTEGEKSANHATNSFNESVGSNSTNVVAISKASHLSDTRTLVSHNSNSAVDDDDFMNVIVSGFLNMIFVIFEFFLTMEIWNQDIDVDQIIHQHYQATSTPEVLARTCYTVRPCDDDIVSRKCNHNTKVCYFVRTVVIFLLVIKLISSALYTDSLKTIS